VRAVRLARHHAPLLRPHAIDALGGHAIGTLDLAFDRAGRTLRLPLDTGRTGMPLDDTGRPLTFDMAGRALDALAFHALHPLLRRAFDTLRPLLRGALHALHARRAFRTLHGRARLTLHLLTLSVLAAAAAARLLAISVLLRAVPTGAGRGRGCKRHRGGACDQHHLAGHD